MNKEYIIPPEDIFFIYNHSSCGEFFNNRYKEYATSNHNTPIEQLKKDKLECEGWMYGFHIWLMGKQDEWMRKQFKNPKLNWEKFLASWNDGVFDAWLKEE